MQATQSQVAGEPRLEVTAGRENARESDDVLSRCLLLFQRMAFRKLGNAADAEDAIQDALLSAYRHLQQFNGGAQMSTWRTTIAINSARMQLRRRSRHTQVSLDESLSDKQQHFVFDRIVADGPSPEDMCRESELHEPLKHLLMQLSAPLRKVFQLRDFDGLTTHEAALLLGVPDGTVKARLTRARAKLRQLMRVSPDANSSSAPLRTPAPVTRLKTKSPRPHLTSTAVDQDGRALLRPSAFNGPDS